MQSVDKHAPLKSKRVGNKKALWITDHMRREMHKRDFSKKKAMFPGTRQIEKLRKPNVNTPLTI